MSYLECLLALILIFIRLSLGAFGECSSEQVSTFPEFAVYYYLLPVATYLLMKEDVYRACYPLSTRFFVGDIPAPIFVEL